MDYDIIVSITKNGEYPQHVKIEFDIKNFEDLGDVISKLMMCFRERVFCDHCRYHISLEPGTARANVWYNQRCMRERRDNNICRDINGSGECVNFERK